ncbi:hypothetical protein P5673_001368 [Acropora cervicornis]|uniref:Uncharacterized protein n=1 Tax=Acropora cervicornis TaxID=6130 RepID=A0AAD9R6A8_ACRCE|nr:hypothetical protein P5673_001368 [Acropora cervicornis]
MDAIALESLKSLHLLQPCARMRNEKRSTKVQTIEKRGGVTTSELRNVYPTGVKAEFSMSI